MKKINIALFSVIFLIASTAGFAAAQEQNTTESDVNIVLLQHLIEVDAVQFQVENRLLVRETLIFKNTGDKIFSGKLRIWVPDGLVGIRIDRRYMMNGSIEYSFQPIQNGNIIRWEDKIDSTGLPPLYAIEYVLSAEPKGTITKTKHYPKVFLYPALTKQPASIVLKVIKNKEESVSIIDEKGNDIAPSGKTSDEDRYQWEMPTFKELRVDISKPAFTLASIAGYLVLGLVIVLVLSYPMMRKKSTEIQAIEEKIRDALKREEVVEEVEEAEEVAAEEITEFEGKNKEELEPLRNEALSKLDELKKEYEAGNLLDEEYDELRKSYEEQIEKINKRMEQL